MNIHDFEKKLKGLFIREKAEVDTDQLWSEVESLLPPARKKYGYRKWLLMLAFIVVGVSVGLMEYSSQANNTKEAFIRKSLDVPTSEVVEIESNEGESIEKPETVNGEDLAEKINKAPTEFSVAKQSEKGLNQRLKSSDPLIVKNTSNDLIRSEIKANHSPKKQAFEAFVDHEGTAQNEASISGDNLFFYTSQKIDSEERGNATSDLSLMDFQLSKLPSKEPSKQMVQNSKGSNISSLQTIDLQLLDLNSALLSLDGLKSPKSLVSNRERRLFLELGASGLFGHGKIQLRNEDLIDHFANRKIAEKSLASYAVHAGLGYRFTGHFSVKSGIQFSNYYKKSSAILNSVESVILDDVVIREIVSSSGTMEVRGQVEAQRFSTKKLSRINQFQTVQVPLELILNTHIGNRFNGELSFGGSYGLSLSKSGFIHPSNTEEYDINQDENGWYNNGAPHFLSFGVGFNYVMFKRQTLFIKTNYLHQINHLNSTDYEIEEKLSGIGISAGIRYNLH